MPLRLEALKARQALARIRAAGWTPRHEETTQREIAQAVPMDQVPDDHPANQPPEVVKRPRQLKRLGKEPKMLQLEKVSQPLRAA